MSNKAQVVAALDAARVLALALPDDAPSPQDDVTPPETAITAGPTDTTATTAVVAFAGTDDRPGPLVFEGSLDGAPFAPVASPVSLSGLALGAHSYRVRARDVAGNVDGSPSVVVWTISEPAPPPVGGAPTWEKLATGGSFGAYFRRPVMLPNGDIWMAWGPNNVPENGSFIFRRASKVFERTSAIPGIGSDIGKRENYGACFVGDGVIAIGAGAPVAYGQDGTLSFNETTGTYTQQFPVTPALEVPDSALLHHDGYLYAFGGWANIATRRRSLATGAITPYGGNGPQFTRQSSYGPDEEESPRLTYVRSGMRANGTIWALANDNELWTCAQGGTWVQRPTTGNKPSTLGIAATLVESRNCIVAWCGRTGMATLGTLLRQTWILDLATMVWSKGPGQASGDVVPPPSTTASVNLLSDGTAAYAVVDVQGGLTEVWVMQWGSP